MAVKVGMVSLGCSKNQVDAEIMLAMLADGGYELCADAAQCDVVIVNTCGFIEDAKREIHRDDSGVLPDEGGGEDQGGGGHRLPGRAVPRGGGPGDPRGGCGAGHRLQRRDLLQAIQAALAGRRTVAFGDKEDLPLEGERILANDPYYAYLKVADGCDNRCTYCAIPLIRGPFRSRPMEKIVEEARQLAANGVTELNVVAQDTTRYGEDLYGRLMLPELLRELCRIDGIRWVRILYCYPDRVTDELLEVMAREEKIVKYMDLPMQHCQRARSCGR